LTDAEGKTTPNLAYSVWVKTDQYILSWINLNLSESVLSTVYGLHTSRQVWLSLATQYASESKTRISQLRRQLQTLQQGSKTCAVYLQFAKSYVDQLAAIGQSVVDEELISFVMSGLNHSFNSFVIVIMISTRKAPMTFAEFRDELLNHELLLNQQTAPSATSTFALTAQKPGGGNTFGFPSGPRPFKPHYPQRYPPQYSNAKPPSMSRNHLSFPRPAGHSGPPHGSSGPAYSSSGPGSSSRPPCQIYGKTSHQALDCFHRMDYAYQGRHPPPQLAAMVAQHNTALEDQQWFADSGANAHITNELENLAIQQPFQGPDSVVVGNGDGLVIENTGSSTLLSTTSPYSTPPFKLKDILHCPAASTNLFSIQKFCKDNACFFILTDSHFYVKDNQTWEILLEGWSENGLYPLRFQKTLFKLNCCFTAFLGLKTTPSVWHFRLGHSSFVTVSDIIKTHHLPLLSGDLSNKKFVCDSCQLGKGKSLPFSASTRVSGAPLELIHSDLWTSPVTSFSACKYYIIFVDDFSRYTWFYPLHAKSDVYQCFVKFKVLVENQFSCKIKSFQPDGGGEYASHQFQNFLSHHGILHRKSCPYTSQQNGLAERKLRHLLETGLTLLAHSGLSNKFWVDAFLTSTYIINQLPTVVLQNISPIQNLFNTPPDYKSLRVFGCKFLPLIRP
jgi:hypothetical protein